MNYFSNKNEVSSKIHIFNHKQFSGTETGPQKYETLRYRAFVCLESNFFSNRKNDQFLGR